ncbi:hypothetical protein PV392_08235 [Streptomyces sp. ME03-5709C]|nr:hypothetical protein [Streptomyces sp. ME03-5709C]
MTGRRIVRLETVDAGEIELHCPAWCTGRHTPGVRTYSDELVHFDKGAFVGPVTTREISMQVNRAWQEYGPAEQTRPYLALDVTLIANADSPEQLELAAATLEAFAAEMRALAPKLVELQQEER